MSTMTQVDRAYRHALRECTVMVLDIRAIMARFARWIDVY